MRMALKFLAFVVLFCAASFVLAWFLARPPTPERFYAAGEPSGPPGRLIAAEPYENVPTGMAGWRILYVTSDGRNQRRLGSAVVLRPVDAKGALPLVAWAHGTTGIAAGCAPSLRADIWKLVPGVERLASEGWAVVAPDYTGLGTAGGHGYLIGQDEARPVIDAIRAAGVMEELNLDGRIVVWGHSQGGHAALWTGIEAASYAPELPLLGIAALAPATDLPALLEAAPGSVFGTIVSAYVVHAYAAAYDRHGVKTAISPLLRPVVADIAGRCAGGYETLISVAEGLLVPTRGIFGTSGNPELVALLAENIPAAPIAAPLFVGQGEADDLVLPQVQKVWVADRCAAGQKLILKSYRGRDHLSVLAADSDLIGDLIAFTRGRFAHEPFRASCP